MITEVPCRTAEKKNELYIADWLHRALGSKDRKNRREKMSSMTVPSYSHSHFEVNTNLGYLYYSLIAESRETGKSSRLE